jgi:Mg-chelatase subunit ChlD
MALSFRCENCGKLLSFERNPGSEVKCPGCKETVAVPEALASLPEPKTGAAAQPVSPAPPEEPEEVFEEEHLTAGAMSSIMAVLMSVLFHVGLAVIFFFIIWLDTGRKEPEKVNQIVIYNPDEFNEDPGGALDESSQEDMRLQEEAPDFSEQEEVDRLKVDVEVPQAYTSTSISDSLEPSTGGGDLGPRSKMFGKGGNAHNIVYVIDASGSMVHSFDRVRNEMLQRIGDLEEVQTFHIVFFNDALKDELPSQRLVPATDANKIQASGFLENVRPKSRTGVTDPTEALRRAYEVLRRADPTKPGNMIFLLTDGDFTGTTRQELLAALRNMSRGVKNVQIFTFLYGPSPGNPNDPNSIESVLTAIANTTDKGEFKHVTEGR